MGYSDSPIRTSAVAGATTTSVVQNTSGTVHGWSLGASGACTVIIYDSPTTTTGNKIGVIQFTGAGSQTEYFEKGIRAENGITVNVLGAGTVQGSVWFG